MAELIFFSTNRTKLSHFRYIAKRYGVRVKSFKEVNYYASYNEPQIDDRDELLKQSYESALLQWSKRLRKIDGDTNTFFFEDTSVEIHALSGEKEFPGVDVKFWMRKTNFSSLDETLRANGNDRSVTVRSDIVMHLPKRWREILGVTNEYISVHGKVHGRIVDHEQSPDLNLVYPWLDDKSFNRWFVPDGARAPLSALDIAEADQFDFRERAFKKIVEVLAELNMLDGELGLRQTQLELPQFKKVPSILVVCGPTCAGKTTVANWLNERYLIPHIEASDFMYRAFWERHGLGSTTKIGDFAEEALKTQPDIVAAQVAEHIDKKNFSTVVVTGFRSPDEITYFTNSLPEKYRTEVVFLDAVKEERLARAVIRNRDQINPEKFSKRDAQELRMGLSVIRDTMSNSKFDNNDGLPELLKKVSNRYKHFIQGHLSQTLKIKSDSNLEPVIILTLFDYYLADIWLTTTEITSSANLKFGLKKFKDNISRYFNQEFHACYDVRIRFSAGGEGRTVEYRLSTTGVAEARLLASYRPQNAGLRLKSSSRQLELFEGEL